MYNTSVHLLSLLSSAIYSFFLSRFFSLNALFMLLLFMLGDKKVKSNKSSPKNNKPHSENEDTAPSAYSPNKAHYDPVKDACWTKDQP